MKTKSVKRLAITAVGAISLILIGYGAMIFSTEIKNTVYTAGIDIEADTFMKNGGITEKLSDVTTVDVKEKVSYIPRITNNAESVYVRVRLKSYAGRESIELNEYLYGIESDWKQVGKYLYYIKPLDCGDTIDICSGFRTPYEWDYNKSKYMDVRFRVDAVQAKNFMPDFDLQKPWGELRIEESQDICNGVLNKVTSDSYSRGYVRIEGDIAPEVMIDTDNLFHNTVFMPGDVYKDSFTVKNHGEETVVVFFKGGGKNHELMKNIKLTIDNGKLFYDGYMADSKLKNQRMIARLKPGEEKVINVTLEMSGKAGNDYQNLETWQIWHLTAYNYDSPETGDVLDKAIYILICLIGSATLIYTLCRKRGEK